MKTHALPNTVFLIALCTAAGCSSWQDDYGYCPPLTAAFQVTPPASASPPQAVEPMKLKLPNPPQDGSSQEDAVDALNAIAQANAEATDRSSKADFVFSTQYFDYLAGQLYEAVASTGFLTTVALKPGEKLVSVAAGDTHRWRVEQTITGSQPSQVLLLVKPLRDWLQTNLVLTTDQRVYQLSLKSVPGGVYNATIAWRYADDPLVRYVGPTENTHMENTLTIAPVQLGGLDFNYEVIPALGSRSDPPPWVPVRVFNDGQKTYIQLPPGNTTVPALFVSGSSGTELVNYRVHHNYYIVDKVIDRAELRLGSGPNSRVKIRHARNPASSGLPRCD